MSFCFCQGVLEKVIPQCLYTHIFILPMGFEMGEILQVDERGRLTIPRKIREKIGIERHLLLEVAEDHLKLKPLKDPLTELEGSLTSRLPFEELRKISEEQLVKEAMGKFRRRS